MTEDNVAQDAVVIERRFTAPVEMLWKMWTEPDHFTAWYGPAGATVVVAKMDVRVGGDRLIGMEMDTPGGLVRMWFAGEYRDVVPHKRVVYTESMADADGKVLSPPEGGMPVGHPTKTEVTVEFIDIDGGTKLVVTHIGIPADSPGAVGWMMALDKLAAQVGDRGVR